jgi:hypothetical protein
MWGEIIMSIKTVELGSENHIVLTLNGQPVGVIQIDKFQRVDSITNKVYDAVDLVGRGIEHRGSISSRFLGMFAASMSLTLNEATIEATEEVLIKS